MIAFGTGRTFIYININAIYEKLGEEKSQALLVFYSFTEVWNCYPQVTHAFSNMALHPYTELDTDNENFKLLEHYTMILYDKNCELDNVNEARKELFCQKSKSMVKLPPTTDALFQHTKRAANQAGAQSTACSKSKKPEGIGLRK